jgi:hypothetical protein
MDYASAEEKFGANVLLEILDFPFKKSVCWVLTQSRSDMKESMVYFVWGIKLFYMFS